MEVNLPSNLSQEKILQATFQFIQAHAERFLIEFYQQMLLEEHATEFLSAEMVKNQLKKLFISVANFQF